MFQRKIKQLCVATALVGTLAGSAAGDSPAPGEEGETGGGDGQFSRQALNEPAQEGVSVEGRLIFDGSVNLHGGVNTAGSALRHLLEVGITFDTEVLFGLQGGTIALLFQNQNGPDASAQDTGDLQAFSNIDADGRTQLAEFWYEQVLLDEKLRVVVGKVDVNALFAFVDNGAEFIHSSPGWSPTILGFPSYPDPAVSVNVFCEPDDSTYFGFGLFDGALNEGVLTGKRGPGTFFHDPSDLFMIGEVGSRWTTTEGLEGRLGLGVWHHTGTFGRFDGGTDDGAEGFYLVFDRALWRKEERRGVNMFAQYGYADEQVSEIEHHLGAGFTVNGLIANRDDDLLGLMASQAWLSDETGAGFTEDYELAIELFYKAQVSSTFSLKPDLQYIIHPGGDALVKDAVVLTLRGELTF